MAKVKVVVHADALRDWLASNKPVRDLLVHTAQDVADEAQATASSAEEGSGGRIDGYASAGFDVKWVNGSGSKRPQVRVYSNADTETATAAHFHTIIRDGVAHMRAALYKFTNRG